MACLSIDRAYRPIGDGFVVQETNGFEFRGNAKATFILVPNLAGKQGYSPFQYRISLLYRGKPWLAGPMERNVDLLV